MRSHLQPMVIFGGRELKHSMSVAAAVAMVVIVAGSVTWLARPGDEPTPGIAAPTPSSSSLAERPATASPSPSCEFATRAFRPRTISVPGVARAASVIDPPRDAEGVPGVAPLTTAGKSVFAWDRAQGIRPGDHAGNVLLNAHTWPDGSALGNRLLAGLQRGDRIVVHGVNTRLCYRVTERVEVSANRGMPRYYTKNGPPQLAIVVCSGRRLGPGVWEKRTVWFASPSA
jgi:hypothetical protein